MEGKISYAHNATRWKALLASITNTVGRLHSGVHGNLGSIGTGVESVHTVRDCDRPVGRAHAGIRMPTGITAALPTS